MLVHLCGLLQTSGSPWEEGVWARSVLSFSMEIPVMFRGVTNFVKTVSLLLLTYHREFLATWQITKENHWQAGVHKPCTSRDNVPETRLWEASPLTWTGICTVLGHDAGCVQCTCHSLGTIVLRARLASVLDQQSYPWQCLYLGTVVGLGRKPRMVSMLTNWFWAHPQEVEGSMSFHQHSRGLQSVVAFAVPDL